MPEPVPPRSINWVALNRALGLVQKALAVSGSALSPYEALREIEIVLWAALGYSQSELKQLGRSRGEPLSES